MKILQILTLVFSVAILINAQEFEKSFVLTGTVYDSVGAVIPKAKVTATNGKGKIFEGVTDDEGIYSVKLPFNINPSVKFKIVIDLEARGFEKFLISDFKFIPAYHGKMYFDIALDSLEPEPCGYDGADCLYNLTSVETTKSKISKKITNKPLKKVKINKENNKQ